MILNVSGTAFAEFGRVDEKGFDHAAAEIGAVLIRQREVSDKQVRVLFVNSEEKTALDILDGTAVLFVGRDEKNLVAFLLDKAVVLNRDIYYFVLPLLSRAKISVASKGKTCRVPAAGQKKPIGIESMLSPERIYTLFYQQKNALFRFKGESHSFWELTYVELGEMVNEASGKEAVLSEGDVMLFLPEEYHRQYSDSGAPVRYITITFDMQIDEPSLFAGKVFHTGPQERELISKILEEQEESLIYGGDLILCYLKELLIGLIRTEKMERYIQSADQTSRQTIEHDIVRAACASIQKNLYTPLTVSEVAHTIPVSEGYLSSVFRKKTGMTPIRYIKKTKLDHAAELIRRGGHTFTQIAELLGFGSVHYFSSQFKKEFGVTPTEYSNFNNMERK